jgi:peptidoglycan/xylan/chitin deacetylase (PgdA/CDA1 family)
MKRLFLFCGVLGLVALLFSQTTPGWKLSDGQLKAWANQVSAGRSLQPEVWPNGARVAVLLSFDVDSQTWELRKGETPSIVALSQGEYGTRVGLKRIVRLMDKHQIPASFFIPILSIKLHPEVVDIIKISGRHEFGIHGWVHEYATTLPDGVEKQLLDRQLIFFEQQIGIRPVGYRAPAWILSPNTIGLLREFGFLYDSSLMADDRPYEINEKGKPTGLVELPVEWLLDDATLVDPMGDNYSSPRDVLTVFKDEFDKAYEEGTMFLLTMHPRVIGHRSRIVILEELIDYIKAKGDVWFATHQQAAEYVKSQFFKE